MEAEFGGEINPSINLNVVQPPSLTCFEREVDTDALYRCSNPGAGMLIGYVSDEYYRALPDTLIELRRGRQAWTAKSAASGAVYVDVAPGQCECDRCQVGIRLEEDCLCQCW